MSPHLASVFLRSTHVNSMSAPVVRELMEVAFMEPAMQQLRVATTTATTGS